MTHKMIDEGRINKALQESTGLFDPFACGVASHDEFTHYMELLTRFRSDLFPLSGVLEHIERYRYRIEPSIYEELLANFEKHHFKM
ncbi:MAG: hypothetical protein HAW67_06140 [Endozoicomonadaceae bacterium]|nr:hypothetical protein [Endozoicomonadaceae bacterium]